MKKSIVLSLLFLLISNIAFCQPEIDQEPWEPELFNILIGIVIGAIGGYLLGKRGETK